jgi:cbb3-type cytochrome oxidase maturation protein
VIVLALDLSWFLFLVCLAMGLGAWMLFVWSVRSGQFKDTEETAQRMLEMDARDDVVPPAADERA